MKCFNLFCFKSTNTKQKNLDPTVKLESKATIKKILYEPDKVIDILLVDDADINRYILNKFIMKLIKNKHLRFTESSNGLDALHKITYNRYDIIFMDIKMPKLNGDIVVQKIREKGIDTIVLGVTGQAEVKKQVIENGMEYCLIKPLDARQLKIYLNTILDTEYFI